MTSGPTPGYSGKPLSDKLGLREGQRASLIDAPPGLQQELSGAVPGVDWKRFPAGRLDCVILFAQDAAALRRSFAKAAASLASAGMLWVGWPKKASQVPTDLTENAVRAHGLSCRLVDVKVCAISDIWSGLKFVRRLEDRT
jgi:hypothetical protein